jgi:hypothetical protein
MPVERRTCAAINADLREAAASDEHEPMSASAPAWSKNMTTPSNAQKDLNK